MVSLCVSLSSIVCTIDTWIVTKTLIISDNRFGRYIKDGIIIAPSIRLSCVYASGSSTYTVYKKYILDDTFACLISHSLRMPSGYHPKWHREDKQKPCSGKLWRMQSCSFVELDDTYLHVWPLAA